MRAINFNEAASLTCFSNDYAYDRWVAEAFKAGDLAILISSSGMSPNIVTGARMVKEMGVKAVAIDEARRGG